MRIAESIDRIGRFLGERMLILVAAAVVVGVVLAGALAASHGGSPRFVDEADYQVLATNVGSGEGYTLDGETPTAFRPPGVAIALAPAAALSDGSITTLRVVNSMLLGVVIAAAAAVAVELGRRSAAVLAAWGIAANPLVLYTASYLYPQVLAAALLLLSILLALKIARWAAAGETAVAVRWSLVCGLLIGALALTVPNHLVVLVAIAAWWIFRRTPQVMTLVTVLALASIMTVGLWTARNVVSMDALIPVSTNGGINLLSGNFDGATADSGTNVDLSSFDAVVEHEQLDEHQRDKYFRDEAVGWIVSNPTKAASLYVGKFFNTFSLKNELATGEGASQSSPLRVAALALTYLPVLGIFLGRLAAWRWLRPRPGEGLLQSIVWMNIAVCAVFFTRLRFRVPVDAVMVVGVAVFVADIGHRWCSRSDDPEGVAATPQHNGGTPLTGGPNQGAEPVSEISAQ